MKNYIGLNIKYLCDKKNISFSLFAEDFGKSQSVISMWVNEKNNPKVSDLQKISKYFKVNLDDFINKDLSKMIATGEGYVSEPSADYYDADNLMKQLEDKKEIIELLKDKIEILESKLSSTTRKKQVG